VVVAQCRHERGDIADPSAELRWNNFAAGTESEKNEMTDAGPGLPARN
jgi:hypothetical protein